MPQRATGTSEDATTPARPVSSRPASDHVRLEADLVGPAREAEAVAREAGALRETVRTVLVVDDDADMRAYVRRCLSAPGVAASRVLEAGDGRAALARLRQGGVDLVITDVVMPEMDGLALCRAARADEALRRIPVLLITGEQTREAVLNACAAEVKDVLLKPFNARKLHAALDALLPRAPPA